MAERMEVAEPMGCLETMSFTRPPQDLLEKELVNHCITHKTSFLAAKILEEDHPLTVCQSGAGYYLGCWDEQGPVSRDSQYYPTKEAAQADLDGRCWEQRMDP